MKLNFWQIIGLVVLLAGIALWVWEKNRKPDTMGQPSSTTSPSTPAATQP